MESDVVCTRRRGRVHRVLQRAGVRPAIAREFGGRDHTTVIHAVEKVSGLMKERRQIYDQVTELIQSIKSGGR